MTPNDTHVTGLNASQIIRYSIPQTQLVISIYTGSSISGPGMRNTLESCLSAANAAMDKYGDVYMFPDPYIFKMPPKEYTGLEIRADSTMVPGLKLVDLIHALTGIEQITFHRSLYKEVHVLIDDEPTGVGMGIINLYRVSAVTPVDSIAVA